MAAYIKSHLDGVVSIFYIANESVVEADEKIAEVEAMKMFHSIESPRAGVVRFLVSLGETVAEGQIIARID